MSRTHPSLFARLCRRLVLAPAGYGRPIDPVIADQEYQSGAWNHFGDPFEQPRQKAVIDYILQIRPDPSILVIGCGSGRLARLLQARVQS